jgi:hypothetical protein
MFSARFSPSETRLTLGAMAGERTLVFSGRFSPSGTSLTLGAVAGEPDFDVLGAL